MKELHDLETYEVSLVPKGANGKQFLVFKDLKGDNGMKTAKEIVQWITKNVDSETMKQVESVIKGIDAAQPGATADGAGGAPLSDKAKAALQAIARIASPMKDEVHPDHLVKVLQAAGYNITNGTGGPGAETEKEDDSDGDVEKDHFAAIPADILSDMKDVLKSRMQKEAAEDEEMEKALKEDMGGAMEEAHKAYKSHLEKLGYRKYPDAQLRMKSKAQKDLPKQVDVSNENHEHGEAQPMDVTKSLDLSKVDPKTKLALEAIFKAQKESVEKAEKLEKELKVERDQRVEKEFIEKASKLGVGGDVSELGKIMKALHEASPEMALKLEATLKAAGEQVKKGELFAEIGAQGGGSKIAGDDAYAKLERMAEGLVQKSDKPLTADAAMEAVMKTAEGKALYNEYMSTKPGMKVGA